MFQAIENPGLTPPGSPEQLFLNTYLAVTMVPNKSGVARNPVMKDVAQEYYEVPETLLDASHLEKGPNCRA